MPQTHHLPALSAKFIPKALRKFDEEETTYVPVKELRRQLARQGLNGYASIPAILKAVDRDFDSKVHYVSVLSELSAREFPSLGKCWGAT